MRYSCLSTLSILVLVLISYSPLHAQRNWDDVEIKTIPVADNVYMLKGVGGNIGISVGDDGVFMIDDQFAPLTEKIQQAIDELTDKPVKFVVNTHYHGDHTGGNENLGEAGAVIIAHENVRSRRSIEQFSEFTKRTTPPLAAIGLPVVTFTKDLTFHFNGDEVYTFHAPHAHTDGDAILFFKKANVIHMGDTFFNGMYPYIDIQSGGSINGVINAVNKALMLGDNDTKYIPGHGEVSDAKGMESYRDFLVTVRNRILALIKEGKTLDEIIALKPNADTDDELGKGFIKPEALIRHVYDGLAGEN